MEPAQGSLLLLVVEGASKTPFFFRLHKCNLNAIPCPGQNDVYRFCIASGISATLKQHQLYGYDPDLYQRDIVGGALRLKCKDDPNVAYDVTCDKNFPVVRLEGEKVCNMSCDSKQAATTETTTMIESTSTTEVATSTTTTEAVTSATTTEAAIITTAKTTEAAIKTTTTLKQPQTTRTIPTTPYSTSTDTVTSSLNPSTSEVISATTESIQEMFRNLCKYSILFFTCIFTYIFIHSVQCTYA